MKKAALIAAALAMTLSLAACGNRDNNTPGSQTNGSGTTENGNINGSNDVNGANRGADTGNDSGAGTGTNGANTGTGANITNGRANGRSSVGNDLRRAADNVGDAVTGLMDDGRSAVTRNTSATSFERMLDNARVHDVDGVLTDGENSRW